MASKYRFHTKHTVLYCCLNWGLGHASRSCAVIRELIRFEARVIICSNGQAKAFLEKQFPSITVELLDFCEIRYSKGSSQLFKMTMQAPKLFQSIRQEKNNLKELINKYDPDLIISDNRYGCFSQDHKSIILIHQLNIQLPKYLFFLNPIIRYIHKKLVDRFSECWIPDDEELNISGKLSRLNIKIPIKHTSVLSQFHIETKARDPQKNALVILSGPEPQRTIFEYKISPLLSPNDTIITGTNKKVHINTKAEKLGLIVGPDLQKTIDNHKVIICRSGYSSICDLIFMNKKAILIPTPGQTEQEYLARYCSKFDNFTFIKQKDIGSLSVSAETDRLSTPCFSHNPNHLANLVSATLDEL